MKGKCYRSESLIPALIEGLVAIFFYFYLPSEAANAGWLGYSTLRWLVGIVVISVWVILLGITIYSFFKPEFFEEAFNLFNSWMERDNHTWVLRVILIAGLLACFESFLLTFLSFPVHLRPIILWLALAFLQDLIWTFRHYYKPVGLRSGWLSLNQRQRVTFFILAAIGLIFFILIIPQNLRGAETSHIFNVAVNDENVTYAPLLWMLSFTGKPEEWIYRLLVYEDYHYGYPFYILSAIVLLPMRLLFGPDFGEQTQINLLILRQMVSSLPILLATFLVVWMNTRFQSRLKSILLFLLILFIPVAASYQIRFWHPDGMVVLAVVVTLFFLNRDDCRLGSNFYAAAIACGLASAIKLYGFFFVLATPVYLCFSYFRQKHSWRKILWSAVIFVVVMSLAILLSNPFLGVPSARQRMIQIQTEKSELIGQGYTQHQPEDIYHVGLDAWIPFLEAGFGPMIFLIWLVISMVIGTFSGNKRLLNLVTICWVSVVAFYLINFSAVKSEHYWLPAMVPLFGAALNLSELSPGLLLEKFHCPANLQKYLAYLPIIFSTVILLLNIYSARAVFTNLFQ